jgi:hypothetical protein
MIHDTFSNMSFDSSRFRFLAEDISYSVLLAVFHFIDGNVIFKSAPLSHRIK